MSLKLFLYPQSWSLNPVLLDISTFSESRDRTVIMSKQFEAFSSSRGQQQSGQRTVVGGKQQGAGQQIGQRAVVGGKQQGVKKDANPRGPKSLEALGADYLRVCASIPGCKPDGAFAETFKTGRIDIALDALGAPELAAIGKSLIALHGLTAISMTVGAEDKRVRRVGPKKEVLINSSVSAANAFFAGLVRTISCSPGLLELRLDGVVLGGVSLTRLARAIEPLERLGSLSLARCGLGDRGLAVLADSLGRSHSVYCLGLRACELGPASGAPLASVFKVYCSGRRRRRRTCSLAQSLTRRAAPRPAAALALPRRDQVGLRPALGPGGPVRDGRAVR
jgi:hypothetical protein